ncbi:MAG: AsmA-like C-terminal region-containing protein [Bacteroidota bacterium]
MTNPTEPIMNEPAERKSPWIFRFLLRVVILLFIILVLAIGTGVVIGKYYQNEVKEYVIQQLNKQLNTEILVDGKDIDFTVLKNFPNASIDFKNVKMLEAIKTKPKDTLFKAGEISLQFNIVDVFKKNYHIKKIQVDNASLKIRIDKNGNDNYHFWKPTADTANTSFSFALEDIVLNKVNLIYKNAQTKQGLDAYIIKTNLAGNFSDKQYSLNTTTDLEMNYLRLDSMMLLKKKNIHAHVELTVDKTMPSYKINMGKLKIENLMFEVTGNVIAANNEPLLNLGITGQDMDIKSVLSLIPAAYKSRINNYESDGEFYFSATIKGGFANKQTPQLIADFGIKNAEITQVKENIVLHKVNLKGYYTNGNKANHQASELKLNPFSATIQQGSIAGELQLKNLSNPSFDGKIKGDISLDNLQKFLKIDTIETISGDLKIDAVFSGEGKSATSGNYNNIATSGNLTLANMNMKLKNNSLPFTTINGSFKFDNNDLEVSDFKGNAGNSDFELKGSFKNMMGFLLKENQDIMIETSFISKNIDLNELLANKDKTKEGGHYQLRFSEHIDVNLNTQIEHLSFRKFDATNISGVIKIKDKKLVADPITLRTMDGSITTSGLVDGSDTTKLLVTCFSEMNNINITKLFSEFENFGSTTITDKNLKGIVNAKVQFASELSPELKIDTRKLYAGVDMSIDNGELNNVEALKSLSKFIELKDLENVRFATLKNQIEIKNQVVVIPKREIKSNAINIIASGTHNFKNEINYKVKLSLNELLAKKAMKSKKENDEFGEVADDGLGRTNLFLSMTGTVEHPIIKYDTKSAIQKVKQDLKVEKQTLKSILKEEFGLFKKDSTLTNKKAKAEDTKFQIKWEEADKKEEKKELKLPKKEESDDF